MPLPRLRPSRPLAEPPCTQRGDGLPCAPLNRVWLLGEDGRPERAYAACTCGERFGIGEAKDRWRDHIPAARAVRKAADGAEIGGDALAAALADVPTADRRVPHAAAGVVPVGTPVIHRATDWVHPTDPQVGHLAAHMVAVMDAAPGIGLAANQVGAGVRIIALNFPRLLPQVWVNPVMVAATGAWSYAEGCLSLEVEGTHAPVSRPREITVVADLPGSRQMVVEADELLARVIQHELDHLEGIEYVQRLSGPARDEVYARIEAEGIDTEVLPARPYATS